MSNTWLIFDVGYLCHRAFYSMRELSFGAVKTGIIYGILRDIGSLQDRFDTNKVVFCFDGIGSERKKVYADYKAKRHGKGKVMGEEEIKVRNEFRRQVELLRTTYLKQIGFKNVFYEDGFESDDIMAQIVRDIPEQDEAIIISADHDMYQCVSHNVRLYNPTLRVLTTLQGFKGAYGMHPRKWWRVLALAGCKTDEVPGIPGIGKKTAIKYLLGTLKEDSKAYAAIEDDDTIYLRNKKLVRLPFKGTPSLPLRQDELSMEGWNKVCDALGMRSLRGKLPTKTSLNRSKGFQI